MTRQPPTDHKFPEIPGFRMETALGYGGFASVFRAQLEDGRPVALKLAHPHVPLAHERVAHEARCLQAVGPPVVPELFGTGVAPDGRPYLVLELLRGTALDKWLKPLERPAPRLRQLMRLARALAQAIARVHEAGWVHLDLKPANLFLSTDLARAQILDLGSACAPGSLLQDTSPATPEYMAPEQCQHGGTLDVRTDIYSFGVILYELFTGKLPFTGTDAELRYAQGLRRPVRPSSHTSLSASLDSLILKALEKSPEDRFQTMMQLISALESELLVGHEVTQKVPARDVPPQVPGESEGAPKPAAQRRTRVLLYFESHASPFSLGKAARPWDGQVVYHRGTRCVVTFDESQSESPLNRAMLAAENLVQRQHTERLLVAIEAVTVMPRRLGSPLIHSASFAQVGSYPGPELPKGVLLSDAVRALISGNAPRGGTEHPFVQLQGRESELQAFDQLAAYTRLERRASVAFFLGERGMGKTALAGAMARRLQRDLAFRTIALQARERLIGSAASTLPALLSQLTPLPTRPPTDLGRAMWTDLLGPQLGQDTWAALSFELGWLTATDAPLGALKAAPGALRTAAARAGAHLLRNECQKGLMAVVVDDAQSLDDVTLDVLEQAARLEPSVPLVVVLCAAPTLTRDITNFGTASAACLRRVLTPLADSAAQALFHELLLPAQNIPARTMDKLVKRSRAVPGLIHEVARGIKSAGAIRLDVETGYAFLATDEVDRGLDLPLVEWIAARELAALPPDLRPYVRLTALLGPHFVKAEVAGIVEQHEVLGGTPYALDVGQALALLVERGLLQNAQSKLQFTSTLLRDAIASHIDPSGRAAIHEAALVFYQRPQALADEERQAKLAMHADRAKRPELAVPLYLDIAKRSMLRHAYVDAEVEFSSALQWPNAGAAPELRVTALRGRGTARSRIGRTPEALADLQEAVRTAEKEIANPALVGDLLLDLATALDWCGDFPKSSEAADRAEQILSQDPSLLRKARIGLAHGRSWMRRGDMARASEHFQQVVKMAAALGDDAYEEQIVSMALLAPALTLLGDLDRSAQIFEKAEKLARAHGDRLHLSAVMTNRVVLSIARKDLAQAQRDSDITLEVARELGSSNNEIVGLQNKAELYLLEGLTQEALAQTEKACARWERRFSRWQVAVDLLVRARVFLLEHRFAEAAGILYKIREEQRRSAEGDTTFQTPPFSLQIRMLALATTHGVTDAEWAALIEESARSNQPPEHLEVLTVRAAALSRDGRRPEALKAYLELWAKAQNDNAPLTPYLQKQVQRLS